MTDSYSIERSSGEVTALSAPEPRDVTASQSASRSDCPAGCSASVSACDTRLTLAPYKRYNCLNKHIMSRNIVNIVNPEIERLSSQKLNFDIIVYSKKIIYSQNSKKASNVPCLQILSFYKNRLLEFSTLHAMNAVSTYIRSNKRETFSGVCRSPLRSRTQLDADQFNTSWAAAPCSKRSSQITIIQMIKLV